ncbi:nitroreductase family deazaflavin-dependent oxidoreductase [Nocardia sp. NPDC088792]|uniref:nitroreductase family deazaflavin-dependent oxidoreductase n=1 Tax=Nocardia sp. NPDC088792 TaxID=3364332 RepID=UPI00381E5DF9
MDLPPDITRPDAHTVLVTESPAHQRKVVQDKLAELAHTAWPAGLVSLSAFLSIDGEKVLTYSQWAEGASGREFVSGFAGTEPIEYHLYRSVAGPDRPVPGCTVVLNIEFQGPDPQRQRQWIDTVLEAMAEETDPAPGGISGHFHVSTDGTWAMPFAEWTDAQAHIDALERSTLGMVGSAPGWQRVRDFPGVKGSRFRRYTMLGSLSSPLPGPSDTEVVSDTILTKVQDSPTDWVSEHVRSYVETDGASGHIYHGSPTLLLTTLGRKSGLLRRTALIYGRDGDNYLVVGSNAAAPQHPSWYLNLLAHPRITVQVKSEQFTATARTATTAEKGRLWEHMASIFPLYDTYRHQTARDIPIVIIEPLTTAR